jgi:hypothetical protein
MLPEIPAKSRKFLKHPATSRKCPSIAFEVAERIGHDDVHEQRSFIEAYRHSPLNAICATATPQPCRFITVARMREGNFSVLPTRNIPENPG